MAKKNQGTLNFYKLMVFIGIGVMGTIGYGLVNAAPQISKGEHHAGPPPLEQCIVCHVQKIQNTPIMPHRPMGTCTFCHKPAE